MTRDQATARSHATPHRDPTADPPGETPPGAGARPAMGRRSRIHDDLLRQRLLDAIRAGAEPEAARAVAGLARSTYFAWLSRGRAARDNLDAGLHLLASERPYLDFLDLIERELAAVEVRALGVIHTAIRNGSWRAAAWWLERQYPTRYGRHSQGDPHDTWQAEGDVSIADLEAAVQAVIKQREQWATSR